MNSCSPEQLLSSNWITNEENSCYPNSSLPGNFRYRTIIFSAFAPYSTYINIPHYSSFKPCTGRVWWAIFSLISMQVRLPVTCQNLFTLWQIFFPATFAVFPHSRFGGFVVFAYFDFFSDIKRVQYQKSNT